MQNILKAIIDYIEGEGITVLPQNYLFDEYMVKNENMEILRSLILMRVPGRL